MGAHRGSAHGRPTSWKSWFSVALLALSACGDEASEPAARAPTPAMSEPPPRLSIQLRPDGLQEVDMRGHIQHRVLLRRGADGALHPECGRGAHGRHRSEERDDR